MEIPIILERMRILALFLVFPFFSLSADEEKVLNLYNWADYVPVSAIRGFEAEYGIKVNYDTYSSDYILVAKLLAGNTGYDVVGMSGVDLQRFLPTGVFRKQDQSKLTNLENRDPALYKIAADYDPGNEYGQIYTWGTTGIAYNLDMVLERMPDAPLDSLAMIFDPEIISRFADCGISFLDDATTLTRLALLYLGYDINERSEKAFNEVEELLKGVRPYVRYFSSSRVGIDLPSGEICLAVTWSGDFGYARNNAVKAGLDIRLDYRVPEEGTNIWVDFMMLPTDLPHPENAHLFLDYMLRPEVAAEASNFYFYAIANQAAMPLVNSEVRYSDITFPPPEVMQRVHSRLTYNLKEYRTLNRMWARVKAGID